MAEHSKYFVKKSVAIKHEPSVTEFFIYFVANGNIFGLSLCGQYFIKNIKISSSNDTFTDYTYIKSKFLLSLFLTSLTIPSR